jgi:hypothetical protein
MHLGLIEGLFVPHNLISTQESPVPLIKFQMAPRLQILKATGSKKERRYSFLFSQKSQQTNPLQVSQQGPYGEGGPFTGHFVYPSKTSSFGSPVKEPSLKVPLMESLAERCPTTRALLHSSIKVPGIRTPPPIPGSPWMERGPHGERCPYPETFLTYLPGSPVKELPPRPPPRSLFKERCSIPRAPFIQLSKSPVDEPSSRCPKWGPYGKGCPFSRAFSTYPSGSPAREPSLQVLFTELPQRGTLHFQSPCQPYLEVPSR